MKSKKQQENNRAGGNCEQDEGLSYIPSICLISAAPKPVRVLLCFGRLMLCGPTGPARSEIGALVLGRLSCLGRHSVSLPGDLGIVAGDIVDDNCELEARIGAVRVWWDR